jgi:hypothetical protein
MRRPDRESIEAAAREFGYRLPTPEERRALMIEHHEKMARLFERVGNADMAAQARAAARRARSTS